MKIAVLTQPLKINYGGILQAYALQTILERRGHQVVIVNRDYEGNRSPWLIILRIGSVIKTVFRILFLGRKGLIVKNPFSRFFYVKWKGYDVQPFVEKRINRSPKFSTSQSLKKYFHKSQFECYVVGSDQVWRPKYSPCITDYFLKEVPADSSAIKIAYAASFGTDEWEFTEEDTAMCSDLVKKFDAVSVREAAAIGLCKNYLGVDAVHLLDPTMLLSSKDYIELFKGVSKKQENLFCYVLDKSDEADQIIKELSGKGYLPYFSSLDVSQTDVNPRPFQLRVEEWLCYLYSADYVVTDSFHACVFSILFKKNFIAVGNKSRGLSRISSLLEMFDLQSRLVQSYEDFSNNINDLLSPIEYSHIESILQEKRDEAFNFFEMSGL